MKNLDFLKRKDELSPAPQVPVLGDALNVTDPFSVVRYLEGFTDPKVTTRIDRLEAEYLVLYNRRKAIRTGKVTKKSLRELAEVEHQIEINRDLRNVLYSKA